MKVLVIGATGATGRLVVRQLIKRNFEVKVIVRRVTDELKNIIINGGSRLYAKTLVNVIDTQEKEVTLNIQNLKVKEIAFYDKKNK